MSLNLPALTATVLLLAACSGGGSDSGTASPSQAASSSSASASSASSTSSASSSSAPAGFAVSISVTGSGTVTDAQNGVTCSATCQVQIQAGTVLSLSAAPAAGYALAGWSGDCTGGGACSVTVSAARSVGATFTASGALAVSVTLHGSGQVSFGLPFAPGALTDPARLRVLVAGVEVPAFSKALARYGDGSLRAALVQFDGAAGTAVVDWSTARTRTQAERPPAWVDVADPLVGNVRDPAVFVTMAPEYLCKTSLRTPCSPLGSVPFDAAFASFARTAVNDVAEPGYNVPVPYAAGSGYVDLSGEEPWLFDRALTYFALYARTGDVKWLRHGHRHAQRYAAQVNSIGIFSLSSYDHDLKYSYGWSPFVDYLLTGDAAMLPVIDRVAQAGVREWQTGYSASLGFWTERHHTYAMLSAVIRYQANGDASSLAYARVLMDTLVTMSNNPAKCPLHTIEQHEGVAADKRLMCSPWMLAMLAEAVYRYWQASADDRAVTWLAGLGDYLVNHAIYDGGLETTELAGRKMTWYLAGVGIRIEDQRGWGDMEHACDSAGLAARSVWAKGRLGQDATAIRNAAGSLMETCLYALGYWTRTTTTLPKYRLNPPRKFNWWFGSTADYGWLLAN